MRANTLRGSLPTQKEGLAVEENDFVVANQIQDQSGAFLEQIKVEALGPEQRRAVSQLGALNLQPGNIALGQLDLLSSLNQRDQPPITLHDVVAKIDQCEGAQKRPDDETGAEIYFANR